jgi:hypothetical protein
VFILKYDYSILDLRNFEKRYAGVRRPGREADRSPSSSATLLICRHGVALI